LRIDELNVR